MHLFPLSAQQCSITPQLQQLLLKKIACLPHLHPFHNAKIDQKQDRNRNCVRLLDCIYIIMLMLTFLPKKFLLSKVILFLAKAVFARQYPAAVQLHTKMYLTFFLLSCVYAKNVSTTFFSEKIQKNAQYFECCVLAF